jgi:hypothetical protein
VLEVSAAAGASGLSPLRFLAPVVCLVVNKLPHIIFVLGLAPSEDQRKEKTYICGCQPEDSHMMRILSFGCGEHDDLKL